MPMLEEPLRIDLAAETALALLGCVSAPLVLQFFLLYNAYILLIYFSSWILAFS